MKPLLSGLFLPCSGMHSPIRANRYPLTTITGAQRASGQTHSRARSHQGDADLRADRSTAYLVSCIRVRSAHGNSCVDGPRLARENVTCRTKVACSHVSGLLVQSGWTAGPDGVREPSPHHSNGIDVPMKRQVWLGCVGSTDFAITRHCSLASSSPVPQAQADGRAAEQRDELA